MILAQLKLILQKTRVANLFELTHQLNSDPDVVRAMLEHWIRKGRVRRCRQITGCGSKCTKCSPLLTEIYEWVSDGLSC